MKNKPLIIALLIFFAFSPIAEAKKKNKLFDYEFMETATLEGVKKAVKKGARIKEKQDDGKTALFYAAGYNPYPEVAQFLIDKGVKVNAKTKPGPPHYASASTALMEGVGNPNPEVIRTLIENGADVKARDAYGGTPLHYAGLLPETVLLETIMILLEAGADADARDDYGKTPLTEAATTPGDGNPDIIIALIAHGADVLAVNREGLTVYALANRAEKIFNRKREKEIQEALRMGKAEANLKLQQLLKKK